jgi:phage gp36-like protein
VNARNFNHVWTELGPASLNGAGLFVDRQSAGDLRVLRNIMTYATRLDLESAWGPDTILRLASRDGDSQGDTAVEAALAFSGHLIDAQLGVRFALPLAVSPPLLVSVGVDLAIDRLAATADMATDLIIERGKQARADLKAIAEGKMDLGLPTRVVGSGTSVATGNSVRPIVGPGGSKLFGPETRGL